MKRFDSAAIKDRFLQQLQAKPNWKNIQKDGATEQFLEAMSESLAEVARYNEYLLRENKWGTARNFSSVKHMARLVGKKLNRKRSAVGTIVVSHSDSSPTHQKRYLNLGNTLFDIDQLSNYDNGVLNPDMQGSALDALTPYLEKLGYSVPIGSIFECKANGLSYVAAERKSIKTFMDDWSVISRNDVFKKNFYAKGGWESYKYLIVPIVQGKLKTAILGTSDNKAAQSFTLNTLDIEAADSYYTSQFCYVEVQDLTKNTKEVWTETNHLSNNSGLDRVFEVNILDDLSGTEIRFGDGINGAIPPEACILTFHYLETAGSAGNVSDLYVFSPNVQGLEIPEGLDVSVGCQNMWSIFGGTDLETIEEFKRNAEVNYSKNYKVMHQFSELLNNINRISPVPLIKTKIQSTLDETTINVNNKIINLFNPVVGVTGLNSNLKSLTRSEEQLFNNIITKKLSDNIISNKSVKYIKPKIVKINSDVRIELETPVLSPRDTEKELEEIIQKKLGKYNLDAMEDYRQVRLMQVVLDSCSNIASLSVTDLLTLEASKVVLEEALNEEAYFVFEMSLPDSNIDIKSVGGYCLKLPEDGNNVVALINVNLGSMTRSYMLNKNNTETTGLYISPDLERLDSGEFVLRLCKNYYKTLNRSELSGLTSLATEIEDSNFKKKFTYNDSSFTFKLGVPRSKILDLLDLPQNLSNADTLESIQTQLDNNVISIETMIECPDQSLKLKDWNSVWYYDNVKVNITN